MSLKLNTYCISLSKKFIIKVGQSITPYIYYGISYNTIADVIGEYVRICKWKCFNSIPAITPLKVPQNIILNSWSYIYLILYYILFSTRRTSVTNQSRHRLVVQPYSLTPSTNTPQYLFPAHHHHHNCKKKINPEIELWGFEYTSDQLSLLFLQGWCHVTTRDLWVQTNLDDTAEVL